MKILRAVLALIIFVFLGAFAYAQEAYIKDSEIIYTDDCPDGYLPLEDGLTLGVGESVAILARAEKMASNKASVASVDDNGVVQALKTGSAVIRTYFSEEEYSDIEITVKKAPASVSLSRKSGVMDLESTYQLSYTLSKNSAGSVFWASSDPSVVSVDQTGLLTAAGLGECVITVETYNDKTAQCKVTVKMPDPAVLTLSSSKGTLFVGETHTLTYTLEGGYHETVFWATDDESIVSVSEDGLLTAHAEGKAVITAVASGGDSAECVVTVKPGPFEITLAQEAISLYENGRILIEPEIEGGSGKYTLYSLDESILSIDPETNEIVAVRAGEAYVLFLTPNYLIAECLVTVLDAPETLTLTASETVFAVGESTSLSLNLDGYTLLDAKYSFEDPSVLKFEEDGTVTGKATGKTAISVSVGGLEASLEIEVQPIATQIRLTGDKDFLGEGESIYLTAQLKGGAGKVTFTADNPSVAAVDETTGLVTAVHEGLCTVTASLVNGVKAAYTLQVAPAPTAFSLSDEAILLGVNDAHRLLYAFNPGAGASVTYVFDENLLEIKDGLLLSKGIEGECILYAETHNGLKDQMTVTVTKAPETVSANASPLTLHEEFDGYVQLKAGSTHNLNASCEGYWGQLFTFVSSHPDIASVTESGTVTAHKAGTVLITVSLRSGASAEILFIVS